MSFHVGQLVVCVDDAPLNPLRISAREDGLRRGAVYTVRDTLTFRGEACVRLAEIVRPIRSDDDFETPMLARRFRPVDEKRIEVFRKALISPRQPIEVGS